MLLEELRQTPVDGLLHEALDRRVAELGLRLALELRVGDLHRDDRGETLAHVLAGEVLVLLVEERLRALARIRVQGPGQRGAEAREVCAPLVRVDVVGEREQVVLVGAVPLHRHLDGADVALLLDVDDRLVERILAALSVDVTDEVADAAVVLDLGRAALPASVGERDPQALREEGHLAEALLEGRAVVLDRVEDLHVRQEADLGAAPVGLLALLQVGLGHAALIRLRPLVAVAPDREVEPLGQRVDHGHADAVETAGNLVAATLAELAAGVQHREHDLGRGTAFLRHRVDGNAAAVVDDRDAVVGVDRDVDLVGLACQRLVDRVVHDLVDEVMETAHTGRADVHAGALADRLQTLEDGDVLGPVTGGIAVTGLLRQYCSSYVNNPGSAGNTATGRGAFFCCAEG